MYAPSIAAPQPSSSERSTSFEALYRAHSATVWTVLSHLGVHAIADAHQEVFITAYRRLDSFDDSRPPRPWLVGIARKVAFRHRRTQSRRSRKRQALTHSGHGRSRQEIRGRLEARDFLSRFLDRLPPTRREIFVRGELEGHTGKEIAQTLNLGLDAVYGQLRSARAQLRSELLAVEADPMPRRRIAQGFAVLMAKVEPSTAGPWIFGLSKTAVGLMATTLAAAVVAPLMVDGPSKPAPAEITRAAVATSDEPPRIAARQGPPSPRAAPATSQKTSAADPAPAPVERPSRPAAATVPIDPASQEVELAAGPSAPDIAEQTRRLTRARQALLEDRAEDALAMLTTHARDFPQSSLTEVRDALRVEVLCALGKTAQARGEARLLLRLHPDSNVARHAATVCASQ